jgi:hypothetical protein
MAIRVGTTAHSGGGIRVSTADHQPFTDALLTGVSPGILRPGGTATLTVSDSSAVALVTFAGVSMTFARPTATTVTFTVPDGYLYGDRPVRAEDSSGAGRTINHPYQPAVGNVYVTLAGYPPGVNVFGTQQRHVGEGYSPQPINGAQLELWNPAPANDLVLYANGTYSVLDPVTLQRRVIHADGNVTAWSDVFVNDIPEINDALANGGVASIFVTAPTGRVSLGDTFGGNVAGILITPPTGSVVLSVRVTASGSIAPITISPVSGINSRTVQWSTVTVPSSTWERQ